MSEVCQKSRFGCLLAGRDPCTAFAAGLPVGAQTYTFISTFLRVACALPVNLQGPSASLYGPAIRYDGTDAAGNLFFVDGNTVLRLDGGSGLLTLVAGNGTRRVIRGDNRPAVAAELHAPCRAGDRFGGQPFILLLPTGQRGARGVGRDYHDDRGYRDRPVTAAITDLLRARS